MPWTRVGSLAQEDPHAVGHLSPYHNWLTPAGPGPRREEPLRGGPHEPRANSGRSRSGEEPACWDMSNPTASTRESARSSEDPVQKKKNESHDEWKIKILRKMGSRVVLRWAMRLKELIIVIVHYRVKFCLSWMFWYQSWLWKILHYDAMPRITKRSAFRLPPLGVVSELMFLFSHVSLCPKRAVIPFLFPLCSGNFLCLLFDQRKEKKKTKHYRNRSQVLVKKPRKCLARGPQSLAALCSRPKPSYPALRIMVETIRKYLSTKWFSIF